MRESEREGRREREEGGERCPNINAL